MDKVSSYFKEERETTNYHSVNLKTGKVLFYLASKKETSNTLKIAEKVQYSSKERDISFHRFYYEERLIGCMLGFCGYDRTPKRQQYIEDLLHNLHSTFTNTSKSISELEEKAVRKLTIILYEKLRHWLD